MPARADDALALAVVCDLARRLAAVEEDAAAQILALAVAAYLLPARVPF
jgi:hypothetical protein